MKKIIIFNETCKNHKLSWVIFSAMSQKPIKKSYFIEGTKVILTSGLAFKNTSLLQNSVSLTFDLDEVFSNCFLSADDY